LESYFQGERELFDGLKIMDLEKDWEQYPVIRLDISTTKAQKDADGLRHSLIVLLANYEKLYGTNPLELTPGQKLTGIIQRACEKTGKQVAVIIDEYDAPLLEVLHDDQLMDDKRQVMQELYIPLKANERYLKFCFITGINRIERCRRASRIRVEVLACPEERRCRTVHA
jgi:hypothetical protein